MISGIFEALAALHGETGFDSGVAAVCMQIADALKNMGL